MGRPSPSFDWQSGATNIGGSTQAGPSSQSRVTPSASSLAPLSSATAENSMAVTQYQPPVQYSGPADDLGDFDFDQLGSPSTGQQYADFPQIDLAARLVEEMQNNHQYQTQQPVQQGEPLKQTSSHQQQLEYHHQQLQSKTPEFLEKLRTMLDNPADEGIEWSADGSSFFVTDTDRFGKKVLPNYFKHNKWTSFVRQLNIYGFHKVPNLEQGTQNSAINGKTEVVEYRNDHFQRDHPELMQSLQRKPKTAGGIGKEEELSSAQAGVLTASHSSGQRNVKNGPEDDVTALLKSNNVWRAVQTIQRAQQNINSDLDFLKASTADLWREATRSRERSRRQQDTMNKILRFLAGVFGAQDLGTTHERANARDTSESHEDEDARKTAMSGAGKGRLLIADSAASERIRKDDPIKEIPRNSVLDTSRFSEARSTDTSPRSRTPPLTSNGRFTAIRSPESSTSRINEISSPRFSESGTPTQTPGGSRRLSQQQGNQIIHALTSEEGSAWLASLFGQGSGNATSQENVASLKADSPSPVVTPGGGFKVDPQTMAALQTVLNSSAASQSDYFDPSAPMQASLAEAEHESSKAKRRSASSSGNLRNTLVPFDAADDGEKRAQPSPTSGSPDQQALALSLSRASHGLQHSGENAASVQESIAALVESLRLDPATLNSLLQQQPANINASTLLTQGGRTKGASRSSSGRLQGSAGGSSTSGVDAVDADSFLDQFLNIGTPGASSESGPSGTSRDGESSGLGAPFAMSPASASRFLDTLGDDDPETQRMRLEDAEEGDTRATADLHARAQAQAQAERGQGRAFRLESPVSGSRAGDESPVTSLSSVGGEDGVEKGDEPSEVVIATGSKRKRAEEASTPDSGSTKSKRKPAVTSVEVEEVGPGRPTRRSIGGRS